MAVTKLSVTVVASAGDFEAVNVFMPGDEREEHPRLGWECEWCGWICVANSRADIPPHGCLSNLDGVRRARR